MHIFLIQSRNNGFTEEKLPELFYCNGLGKVSRLVDICTSFKSYEIGEELGRNRKDNRGKLITGTREP